MSTELSIQIAPTTAQLMVINQNKVSFIKSSTQRAYLTMPLYVFTTNAVTIARERARQKFNITRRGKFAMSGGYVTFASTYTCVCGVIGSKCFNGSIEV